MTLWENRRQCVELENLPALEAQLVSESDVRQASSRCLTADPTSEFRTVSPYSPTSVML